MNLSCERLTSLEKETIIVETIAIVFSSIGLFIILMILGDILRNCCIQKYCPDESELFEPNPPISETLQVNKYNEVHQKSEIL